MSNPNPASELFNGLLTILEQEVKALTPDELKACAPALVSFFQWLAANPTAVGNPVAFVPKLAALKMTLLAAQGTVANELVVQASSQLAGLFQTLLSQVQAPSGTVSASKPV
jgi:hypothetical protein